MAIATITNTEMVRGVASAIPTATALDATLGLEIAYTGADGQMLILIENSSATTTYTAYITKGNALQGTEDYSFSADPSTKHCVVIESGKFVNASGTYKGKIVITGGAALKAAAVVLP